MAEYYATASGAVIIPYFQLSSMCIAGIIATEKIIQF